MRVVVVPPDDRSSRVKRAWTRLALLATLTSVAVLVAAAPAGASTGVVLADARFKWFYWIGFLLAVSLVGYMFGLAVAYVVRVLRPKWRGRPQS
jgi:hypothetical protein